MSNSDNILLQDLLSTNLPAGFAFKFYHISTPPTKCAALFSPLPGRKPEKTYCESHFLQVTIQPGHAHQVAIFAIEVLIYTTAHLTTLFVSKADSTGFGILLDSGQTTASPLRAISSTFISWLARPRHRPDRRLVISLFARAQGQYLFPGSVEHGKKHVLDDRGLVKWWCRTLDPVLREYASKTAEKRESEGISSEGFLIVPGQDKHETNAFFPVTLKHDSAEQRRWINDHPLRQLSEEPYAHPRCLIPHFPDDPKARYLLELDDEVSEASMNIHDSPSKKSRGAWRNVKTLEQFWEMMAFRQECSSGRLVGFIWIVFTPPGMLDVAQHDTSPFSPTTTIATPFTASRSSPHCISQRRRKQKQARPLRGPILPRAPKIKPSTSTSTTSYPHTTRHYHSPPLNRGALLLPLKSYTRAIEALLRLDYSDLAIASASTAKWIREVGVLAGRGVEWGVVVKGKLEGLKDGERTGSSVAGGGVVNILSGKRKACGGEVREDGQGNGEVHRLEGTQVRKKPKVEGAAAESDAGKPMNPGGITTLGSLLVRKKAKKPENEAVA